MNIHKALTISDYLQNIKTYEFNLAEWTKEQFLKIYQYSIKRYQLGRNYNSMFHKGLSIFINAL